ncbi:MAG: dodecin family protein [Brevundimonas sp.]|jgi:dodecin|uniref:dodecin family protein n=1 Tax=Brevundimonas sp. Leaf280 TaxID=1736320 RepID=UPI0007002F90|nr:dodecin family protein [Brevundimonas sp. Leaf280]KQP46507.1 dodecin [Brevundimonas sp. Leaf280]
MAILKVIEVLSESRDSWEAAAQMAVEDAAITLRHIRSINIDNFQATVVDGLIDRYRVNARITFAVDDDR